MLNKIEERLDQTPPPLAEWVDSHADVLFRYAMLRVRDEHVAEDLLQETFLAALKSLDGFRKDSAVLTWLTAILHHKIIDHYRFLARTRQTITEHSEQREADGRTATSKFKKWNLSPEQTIENDEFWSTLMQCISKLPESIAIAFRLREIDGCDSEVICQSLNISSQNLAVRVFRARQALQSCLNQNWFSKS